MLLKLFRVLLPFLNSARSLKVIMGKSRNNRSRKNKCNPTGLPAVKDTAAEEEFEVDDDQHVAADSSVMGVNGVYTKTVNPLSTIVRSLGQLINQLQSKKAKEKECACCTLTTLIDKPEAIPNILGMDIIRIIGPLLNDGVPSVRYAVVGALRKLSSGSHEACEEMVTQDVMTSLVCLFKIHFSTGWQGGKLVEGKTSLLGETFIEAVYLLLNLCESSSRAVKVLNRESMLGGLIPHLNVEQFGENIAIAVAYCLQTVTEDNSTAVGILNEKANEAIIDALFSSQSTKSGYLLLRNLAAGIILNRNFGQISRCSVAFKTSFMKLLADTLSINSINLVNAVALKIDDMTMPNDASVASLEWILSSQQLALELLTNICCSDDDGDKWEDAGNSDASDEIPFLDDEPMDEDDNELQAVNNISPEIAEAVVGLNFIDLVLSRISLPEEEILNRLKSSEEGKKLLSLLLKIQSRALLCFNNLVSSVDVAGLCEGNKLYNVWIELGKLVFSKNLDIDVMEAATKAMAAVIKKLIDIKYNQLEQFPLEDLERLFNLVRSMKDGQVKANVIRIVGNLGCLLFKNLQQFRTHLNVIGMFLLEVCNREDSLWLTCEAVDAIMDVFSEDEVDCIVQDIGLVEKLKTLLPQLKHKIAAHRREADPQMPFIITAKTNLARFIKYKMNLPVN